MLTSNYYQDFKYAFWNTEECKKKKLMKRDRKINEETHQK